MAACLTELPTPSFDNWVGPPNSSAIILPYLVSQLLADLLSLNLVAFLNVFITYATFTVSI